jgi:hypothetical protein
MKRKTDEDARFARDQAHDWRGPPKPDKNQGQRQHQRVDESRQQLPEDRHQRILSYRPEHHCSTTGVNYTGKHQFSMESRRVPRANRISSFISQCLVVM